jgi:hypothetical protein
MTTYLVALKIDFSLFCLFRKLKIIDCISLPTGQAGKLYLPFTRDGLSTRLPKPVLSNLRPMYPQVPVCAYA